MQIPSFYIVKTAYQKEGEKTRGKVEIYFFKIYLDR